MSITWKIKASSTDHFCGCCNCHISYVCADCYWFYKRLKLCPSLHCILLQHQKIDVSKIRTKRRIKSVVLRVYFMFMFQGWSPNCFWKVSRDRISTLKGCCPNYKKIVAHTKLIMIGFQKSDQTQEKHTTLEMLHYIADFFLYTEN